MVATRQITYPIQLTSAQLAVLLSYVHAETLLGSDEERLFPSDEAQRNAQWERGKAELEADRWMIHDPATNTYQLSDLLMLIIAALADPEVVVLSEWQSADHESYGVANYLSLDLVIDMTIIGGVYYLVVIDSLSTMAMHLAQGLDYPAAIADGLSVCFAKAALSQVNRQPDVGWLTAQGAGPLSAQAFVATLKHPAQKGTIIVARTYHGHALDMRMLDVIVGAEGTGWIGTLVDDQLVRYDAVDAEQFTSRVSSLVSEVRTMPLEPLRANQAR